MKRLFKITYKVNFRDGVSKFVSRIFADYEWASAFYDQCPLVDKNFFACNNYEQDVYNFVLCFGYFGCDETIFLEYYHYGAKNVSE